MAMNHFHFKQVPKSLVTGNYKKLGDFLVEKGYRASLLKRTPTLFPLVVSLVNAERQDWIETVPHTADLIETLFERSIPKRYDCSHGKALLKRILLDEIDDSTFKTVEQTVKADRKTREIFWNCLLEIERTILVKPLPIETFDRTISDKPCSLTGKGLGGEHSSTTGPLAQPHPTVLSYWTSCLVCHSPRILLIRNSVKIGQPRTTESRLALGVADRTGTIKIDLLARPDYNMFFYGSIHLSNTVTRQEHPDLVELATTIISEMPRFPYGDQVLKKVLIRIHQKQTDAEYQDNIKATNTRETSGLLSKGPINFPNRRNNTEKHYPLVVDRFTCRDQLDHMIIHALFQFDTPKERIKAIQQTIMSSSGMYAEFRRRMKHYEERYYSFLDALVGKDSVDYPDMYSNLVKSNVMLTVIDDLIPFTARDDQ